MSVTMPWMGCGVLVALALGACGSPNDGELGTDPLGTSASAVEPQVKAVALTANGNRWASGVALFGNPAWHGLAVDYRIPWPQASLQIEQLNYPTTCFSRGRPPTASRF